MVYTGMAHTQSVWTRQHVPIDPINVVLYTQRALRLRLFFAKKSPAVGLHAGTAVLLQAPGNGVLVPQNDFADFGHPQEYSSATIPQKRHS